MSTSVASMWRSRILKKIDQWVRMLQEEFEEINCLKQAADESRDFRKKIIIEKND